MPISRANWPTGPKTLAACSKFDLAFDRAGERLGSYALLKTAEDAAKGKYQRMQGRFSTRQPRRPGGQLYPPGDSRHRLGQDAGISPVAALAPYELLLGTDVPLQAAHARQEGGEAAGDAERDVAGRRQMFHQLNDADMKFGTIKNEQGRVVELSHATFSSLLHSPRPEVRRAAFHNIIASMPATSTRWRRR